jgi:hypothetical protein
MNISEIYEKYRSGDPISDEELKFGIKEFSSLEKQLNDLGARFHFTWKEVSSVLRGLEDFKRARKE